MREIVAVWVDFFACFLLGRTKVDVVAAGDICAVVGLETVDIGNTIADRDDPKPLPILRIDQPTLHMTFRVNDSPFAGRSGGGGVA